MLLNVEDHQIRFLICKLCVVFGLSFKKLLPYWNDFTVCGPEFHYWYNSEVVVVRACYGHVWSEMHCFLCCCQYITYRNKKDIASMVCRQLLPCYVKHGKCYLWFGEFESFFTAYQISSEWKLLDFFTLQISPVN